MSVRTVINGTEYVIGGIGGEILPVGTIVDYDGVELPEGWSWYTGSGEDVDLTPYSYVQVISTDTAAGATITLPCSYLAGKRTLDIFLNGSKLICTDSSDTTGVNGHYYELGNLNEVSNTIKLTSDWYLSTGDVLELIVRGLY